MKLSDFDYELPADLIANTPVEPRDSSRLMIMDKSSDALVHRCFSDIVDYLVPGDLLVFNDTRVIPDRLRGHKRDTGAAIEVFLLHPVAHDEWEVLVRPGKKARPGAVVDFAPGFSCEILTTTDFGGRRVRFDYQGDFDALLDEYGEVPLPPYIADKIADSERYQTVYAEHRGSVAAPTAGLHFTPALLQSIRDKGVECARVTLHVGIGTFRPVEANIITDHVMHSERYHIPAATATAIRAAKAAGRRVIAVGTTAVRSLESWARAGELSSRAQDIELSQQQNFKFQISNFDTTNIFIYPGYHFAVVDAMITNFHLPKSSLLMLVSAFAGYEKTMAAYRAAIAMRYRFFSFGDAMLIV